MLKLAVDNTRPGGAITPRRRALLSKVHVAKKALALTDDDYRAVLERVTKRRSAKDCSDAQLDAVLAEFERLGFHSSTPPRSSRTMASHPVARKARALWVSLYQLAAIDDPSERALEAFGARQLKVERLQWADQSEGYRLVEALKAMADRAGYDQRLPARMPSAERIRVLKDRLVSAQLGALAKLGRPVSGPLAGNRDGWSTPRLERVAGELGVLLREARG